MDRYLLVGLLGLREGVLDALSVLRNLWRVEPSMHGGMMTAIGHQPAIA